VAAALVRAACSSYDGPQSAKPIVEVRSAVSNYLGRDPNVRQAAPVPPEPERSRFYRKKSSGF